MRKRLRTVMFGIGLMILLAQPAFAEELGQANITPDMTMQEIRSDPVMQQSGLFLYGSFGEGTQWTRSRLENQTLQEYDVSDNTAGAASVVMRADGSAILLANGHGTLYVP